MRSLYAMSTPRATRTPVQTSARSSCRAGGSAPTGDREETTKSGFFHQDIQNGFLQTIKNGFEQNVTGTYAQRIFGFHKQQINDGFDQTIAGFYDQKARAGARQTVTGEFERHVTGNVDEQIDGYLNQHVGEKKVYTKGNSVKVTLGWTDETTISGKNSNFIGGQANITFAIKADLNLSVARSYSFVKWDDTTVAKSSTNLSVSRVNFQLNTVNFQKSKVVSKLTETDIAYMKGQSCIWSAAFAIFK